MSHADCETLLALLTPAQQASLQMARTWWQEGDRSLEYLADIERKATLAARLRTLITDLKASPTAESLRPILQATRLLTGNRALTRRLETDAFARALIDLLDEETPLPERLASFLQTPAIGPYIASHLLYAAAPERFPLLSPDTLSVLNFSRRQRQDARLIALDRYSLTDSPDIAAGGEAISLLTNFTLYEAARRELDLADFLELHAILSQAREMPKRSGNGKSLRVQEGKTAYGKSQRASRTAEDVEPTESDLLNFIEGAIEAQGFTFPALVVRDYYVSLKAKPFVILSGLSGTGKTRLTRLFADILTGKAAEQYLLLPVRPDWTDSAPLLGYHNPLTDRYISTPFLNLLRRASAPENQERAFFVCLDEMNLARVEHYFAELLSGMETPTPRHIMLPDGRPAPLPANVFLTGSVNMDEATYPFSRKALDRANLIEFSEVRLKSPVNEKHISVHSPIPEAQRQRIFLANGVDDLLMAQSRLTAIHPDFCDRALTTLSELNALLEPRNLHFGYRVRDEVLRYLAASFDHSGAGLLNPEPKLNFRLGLDLQILQKTLPRLSGTAEMLESLLKNLEDWARHEDFPRAAAKLARMRRRAAEEGIVTFYEF